MSGPISTRLPFSDVCKALFGETLTLGNGDGYESWKTDRPMRKEGFNVGKMSHRN